MRQLGVRLVMVGNDEIDPEVSCARGRLRGADAAVDGNYQLHAVLVQAIDRGRLQAVAVAETLGEKVHDVSAEHFERTAENHCRRHAIDVVVTMNDDTLFRGNRGENALDRGAHVGQSHRVVKIFQPRRQKPARILQAAEAADAEQPRRHGRHAKLPREPFGRTLVARDGLPDTLSLH